MRLLYLLVKLAASYSLRIYFPRQLKINAPKRFFGRTIYVSNHPSSFMDPIVIGTFQHPLVFFMTRSDIFTPIMKPILWLTQMLPIYRQLDGDGAVGKNSDVFKSCTRVLNFGRNLLIFGEGFTDDVFVRRLKPVKKGAARIGFTALESMQWKKKVYMAAIGINYGNPNYLGSDVVLSNSERFCLNDYKEMYLENPNKAITEVTRRIEGLMREQITHVADPEWTSFHEEVIQLQRNGLHPENTDFSIPLKTRFENSKKIANWLNTTDLNNPELLQLKKELSSYYEFLKQKKIQDNFIVEFSTNGKLSTQKEFLYLCALAPLYIVGKWWFALPYWLVKTFTEKTFKRPVFWSSVKMMLGMLALAIWFWPLVAMLNHFVFKNGWIALGFYFLLPLVGVFLYNYRRKIKIYRSKKGLLNVDLSQIQRKREDLEQRIKQLIERP
jgi:1-acyl-sn-glycerol-3-phosphate acyltransferase